MEIRSRKFPSRARFIPDMRPSGRRRRARQAFDYADTENAGSLTKPQYKVAMTAVFGYCPDKMEVKHVFESTERISYEEFERWVFRKYPANGSQVSAEVLFTLLDKDYKGYLVLEDFCSASKSVNLNLPRSVWETVFKDMDCKKRGYIDFNELSRVLPSV